MFCDDVDGSVVELLLKADFEPAADRWKSFTEFREGNGRDYPEPDQLRKLFACRSDDTLGGTVAPEDAPDLDVELDNAVSEIECILGIKLD